MKKTLMFFLFCFGLLGSQGAGAVEPNYRLDPAHSTIGFVAVKNGHVEVPGVFKKVAGEFRSSKTDQGERLEGGFVTVDISSLQTPNNPVRDQNIRNTFFEISKNPEWTQAQFSLKTPISKIALGAGKPSQEVTLQGTLSLHGRGISLKVPVLIAREGKKIVVKNQGTMTLPFARWDLKKAVKNLMKVCGHKTLQDSATLNFKLVFKPI